MKHSDKPKSIAGFSLIELMITVAVVGILAAVALPSYLNQVRKSRRADAQAVLMNIAARQQQMMLDTRSYAATTTALNISVPTSVSNHYTIAVSAPAATVPTFSATATPTGNQASDSCGALGVNEVGEKSAAGANCW